MKQDFRSWDECLKLKEVQVSKLLFRCIVYLEMLTFRKQVAHERSLKGNFYHKAFG